MEMDKDKVLQKMDLLRMKLLQQRELSEGIEKLYNELNEALGTPITVPFEQKFKAQKGWGPDPSYVPRVTPESQAIRDHTMTKEF
jgi:hypothetical protein